jgi:3-deoxy-7-phosphoheptulonate synthase
VNKHGQSQPNYHFEELTRLHKMYAEKDVQNMAVIIDCNHNNSGKQYLEQIRITREVLHSRRNSPEIGKLVKGIMLESYIEDGCQKIGEGIYGKSITDPCLGWEKTEKLIYEMADLL